MLEEEAEEKEGGRRGRTISGDEDGAVLVHPRELDVYARHSVEEAFRPLYRVCCAIGPLHAGGRRVDHEVRCTAVPIVGQSALRLFFPGCAGRTKNPSKVTHSWRALVGGATQRRGRGGCGVCMPTCVSIQARASVVRSSD